VRIFGGILIVLGFLFSLSIVGAIFGIPMMLIGLVCVIFGGRRRTVITNVVQVSNVVPQQAQEDSALAPAQRVVPGQAAIPHLQMQNRLQNLGPAPLVGPVIDAEFREERPGQGYDHAKWDALVKYDADIARVVAALKPYGQSYVDELAAAYLVLNDKRYLGMIVQKIVADARQAQAAAQQRAAPQRG
jgi:hypothetical protein